MVKHHVGEHVELKGFSFGGHTGTIKRVGKPNPFIFFHRLYYVQLDGTALGHSIVKVTGHGIQN